MTNWVLPTIVYIALVGAMGVTTKYALRGLSWDELTVWTTLAYCCVAVLLVLTGMRVRLYGGLEGAMAAISAVIAPTSLVLLFLALRTGEAGRVIPLMATYPLITVVLALLLLAEPLSVASLCGAILIVAGVVLLTL